MKIKIPLILAAFWPLLQAQTTSQENFKILYSPGKRYVYGQVGSARADQFLLDTETGRMWLRVKGKDERPVLEPVAIIQILGDEAYSPESEAEVQAIRDALRKLLAEKAKEKTNQKIEQSGSPNPPPPSAPGDR